MKQEEKTRLTRKKITDAAISEFGAKGYEKANINTICASGITKGLIYHNFADKDELYLECLKLCFEEITTALACPGNTADSSVYFEKRIKLFKERRASAAMVLEALIDPPKQHIKAISALRKSYDEMNNKWIMNILKNGQLRENVTQESAVKYLALMQDMFNRYCIDPKFEDNAFEYMIEMHERELPRIFEYMLCGVLKGE